jgi:hypothetical protein
MILDHPIVPLLAEAAHRWPANRRRQAAEKTAAKPQIRSVRRTFQAEIEGGECSPRPS